MTTDEIINDDLSEELEEDNVPLVIECNGELDDDAVEARIRELMSANPVNLNEIEEFIEKARDCYWGNIDEFAFCAAVECNAFTYVEKYIYDIDLNNEEGYSPYLDMAETEEMLEFLKDNGALRSCEEIAETSSFCMETLNGTILAFDTELQKEVFEKILERSKLTKENIIEFLSGNITEDELGYSKRDFGGDLEYILKLIGVELKDGELAFVDATFGSGYAVIKLFIKLGIGYEFKGDSWKLETTGAYYIEDLEGEE